jgi:hypothetical protein
LQAAGTASANALRRDDTGCTEEAHEAGAGKVGKQRREAVIVGVCKGLGFY